METFQIKKSLISGNPSIRICEDYYQNFFNQQKKQTKRKERLVFANDYQIYLWAFLLGYESKVRTPLEGKTNYAFKWDIIEKRFNLSRKIIGLLVLFLYENDPSRIKSDYQEIKNENTNESKLSQELRIAFEEFANTGFDIIAQKEFSEPGYIHNGLAITQDILGSTED